MGRRGQQPAFEAPVFAGGDQHGGLAVGGLAEAHVCNLGLVGGRDGGVEHKAVGDRESVCHRDMAEDQIKQSRYRAAS